MATVKLRYVNKFKDRHGKPRYYFRKGATCEPMPGVPGSAVFSEAYDLLLATHARMRLLGVGGLRPRRERLLGLSSNTRNLTFGRRS